MTKVIVYLENQKPVGLELAGHTGYGVEGEDIVCSAVSALTQTMIMSLETLLNIDVAYEISQAQLYCMLPKDLSASVSEKAILLIDSTVLGLKQIQSQYGEFLNIKYREV